MASEAAEKWWFENCCLGYQRSDENKEAVIDGFDAGASAKETELRAPMECGHPNACWYKPNELSPLAGSLNGEAIPFDGVCLACRQLTERVAAAEEATQQECAVECERPGGPITWRECAEAIRALEKGALARHDAERERALRAELLVAKAKLDTFAKCNSGAAEEIRIARDEIAALKESLRWVIAVAHGSEQLERVQNDTETLQVIAEYCERARLSPAPASTPKEWES